MLTFCPDRGLRHGVVHNADEQEGTDAGGDLEVAVRYDLEVPRRVHVLKVDACPVPLGAGEHRVGRCGVADERGPDAREGRYRMAHDARGELLRLLVARGEAARLVARFAGELPEDRQRGFVVPDDAAVHATGTPSARVRDDAETLERGGGGKGRGSIPRPLSDECVAPEVAQQLDGAPAEGTRDVQEDQYWVPTEDFAREKHHVADVLSDGDCHDSVDELGRQLQRRIPNRSRRRCVLPLLGWGSSHVTAPSSFP